MKHAIHKARQGGSMLIEALVSLLIFSIGVLSLIGMQATAIKQVNDAKFRSDASFLANQVIGEMWVNRTNLAAYAYAGGQVPTVLGNWIADVQSALPGADVNPPTIAIGAGNVVTVTVSWQPPNTPTPHKHLVVATINN